MDTPKTAEHGEIVSLLHRLGLVSEAQLRHAERVWSKLATPTSFLNILKELGVVNDEMVRKALAESNLNLRIGELLVELGHISSDDLRAAFAIQQEREKELKLGEVLIKYNFIEEKVFNRVLSMQLGFPLVDVNMSLVDRAQVARLPIKTLVDFKFLPLKSQGKETLVAFADPLDKKSLDVARRLFGSRVSPAICEKKSIAETLKLLVGLASGKTLSVDNKTVTGVANAIIIAAIENNASDIHIEPFADRLQVRFREDGVLRHHRDFEREIISPLISRFKIMCSADIAEKRRHQGGRILFEHEEGHVDIRVSFYVTVHGEKVVMRLLKQKRELIDIRTIGMAPKMLTRFLEDAVYSPTGVLLVTGPTGSGKTSTVYSCINHVKNPQISIITAEEPVEYFMDGVAQCSIEPAINLTFEETLRHIVRQDPDIIFIGEIRDNSSAEMAMQAALTGHKVLSTFHTEDSIGCLVRLVNMDIAPYLVSSTVACILAQRLLRRVCSQCAMETAITPVQLKRLGVAAEDLFGARFQKGRGCSACKQTGYSGRIGVYELLIPNELVRSAVLQQKTSYEIRQISIEHSGLVTLLEDGLVKAAAGVTSVEEVLRSLPKLDRPRPLAELRRLVGE